jgi:iron-sulfur cluster repair protein YtfE (RIC family)
MTTRSAEVSPVARTVKEHGSLLESITRFDAILAGRSFEGLLDRLVEIRPLLEQGLARHFATEERIIFPAIILGARDQGTVDCVLELQKAHGRMEEEVRQLFALLDAGVLRAGAADEVVVELLTRLITELKVHASQESAHVFPMAEDDQQIQRHLCRLIEHRRVLEE